MAKKRTTPVYVAHQRFTNGHGKWPCGIVREGFPKIVIDSEHARFDLAEKQAKKGNQSSRLSEQAQKEILASCKEWQELLSGDDVPIGDHREETRPRSTEKRIESEQSADHLSDEERAEFHALEKQMLQGQRDTAEALRIVRTRKLYREHFATFDDYMERRWLKSRQWATQQTNWLAVVEFVEERDWGRFNISVIEAQHLKKLTDALGDDDAPQSIEIAQLMLDALEEAQGQADEQGKTRTSDMTIEAVGRRLNLLENRQSFGGELSLDESLVIDQMGGENIDIVQRLLEEARREATQGDHSPAECLQELVERSRAGAGNKNKTPKSKPKAAQANRRKEQGADSDNSQSPAGGADFEQVELAEHDVPARRMTVRVTGDLVALCEWGEKVVDKTDFPGLLRDIADTIGDGDLKVGGITFAALEE